MSNDNDDDDNDNDLVDDETINEQDDDNTIEQEKWYYKAKLMLNWVSKFSGTHCVHRGFAIINNEMMKLFKDCSNMTHRMKKTPLKKVLSFM